MKKRILPIVLTSLILLGCGVSTEKKIEKVVNEEVKKNLYIPDSYDPVETIVDSAFSPYDNPSLLDKMIQLVELGSELEKIEFQLKQAKSSMALWEDQKYGYYSSYERNEYEEAKENYEKALEQQSLFQSKGESIANEIRGIVEDGNYFVGYKVTHRYRAKNNAGRTIMADRVLFLDKEATKVVANYGSDDYKAIQMAIDVLSNNQ
jgi:hypothetical protein